MLETSDGKVYKSLITLERLESTLGDSFLKVHRSRLVSVMAIHANGSAMWPAAKRS